MSRSLPVPILVLALLTTLLTALLPATADEAVQKYERKSVTYFQVDAHLAPVNLREKAVGSVRAAVELSRFDVNDLGKLGNVSLSEIGTLVKSYLDKIKISRAREQAEYDVRFKDEIITADMLQRIVDSAFLYSGTITRWKTKSGHSSFLMGMDVPAVETVIEAELAFWKVNFDTGEVEAVTTVTATGAGYGLHIFQGSNAARRDSQNMAMHWLTRNLSAAVRSIPQFSLKVNVTRAGVNNVWIDMTAKDGVVADSLFKVKEKTADGLADIGWIKIRSVGDGEDGFESRAEVISVSSGFTFDGGELLEEYPQSGLEFGGSAGAYFPSIEAGSFLDGATAGGAFSAKFLYDLAESTGIPELWVGGQVNVNLPLPNIELGLEPEIQWRTYFRRLILGIGLAGGVYQAFLPSLARGQTYITRGIGIRPLANLAIWFGPHFQLYAEGAYRLYGDLSATGFVVDSDGNDIDSDTFSYNSSGLQMGLGFRIVK